MAAARRTSTHKDNWSVEQRYQFIEFSLHWAGHINRSDIIEVFGISKQQASNDLANYIEGRKSNLSNDRRLRTNVADMRLWAAWETDAGKQREQVFATMTWQPKKQTVFARTKLTPVEFTYFGFDSAVKPKAEKEPQNSEIQLFEENWRYGALPFIGSIEAAKMRLTV